MLTFLRKIRQSLIVSGSVRKPATPAGRYLLYAIGEIALVVIGILIALQINNWNERRKDRILEHETLQEIAENISLNIEVFEDYVSGLEYMNTPSDYVLDVLHGVIPYTDSLDLIINNAIYQRNNIEYSTVAYESLKNNNLNLIRNRKLKKEIVSLFEISYPNLTKVLEWENEEKVQDYMDHHFYPMSSETGLIWKPYNIEVILKDDYFKSLIAKVKIQRDFYVWQARKPLEKSKSVLRLIIEELSK